MSENSFYNIKERKAILSTKEIQISKNIEEEFDASKIFKRKKLNFFN